jgi:hypothetical protein
VRIALLAFVSVALLTSAFGQAVNDRERVIRRTIDQGISEGWDQKILGGMGDAAAVLLTKILGGEDLNPTKIDMSMVVLYEAFADPRTVEPASEREPRTALLLLRYLDLESKDAAQKKRIAETVKYLKDRYAASLQPAQH